jgi:citrate lyase beta subunit
MAIGHLPRSLLFAPGIEPRKLARAAVTQADMVVADLEDSVPEDQKSAARDHVARFCSETGTTPMRAVRINALDGPHAVQDLALLQRVRPEAVVVPKAEAASLGALALDWAPLVIAIVETARGLQTCATIAEIPHVAALMLGGVDLGDALRLRPRADGLDLLYARSQLVIDSAAAGIAAPLDGVYVGLDDAAGLQAEAELSRSLGFGGKAAIHPSQLDILNRVFGISEADVNWAHRVLDAYAQAGTDGRGALRLDGAMVDLPVVKRAEAILAAAREDAPSRPL